MVAGDYGLFTTRHVTADEWENNYCISYNWQFKTLPQEAPVSSALKIVDLTDKTGCQARDYASGVNNSIVIVARGECSFGQKGEVAQSAGAAAIMFASENLVLPGGRNESDYNNINITLSVILWSDVSTFKNTGGAKNQLGAIYLPKLGKFDANMIVIFLIAVSLIVIGGYWSGIERQRKYEEKLAKMQQQQQSASVGEGGDTENKKDEDSVDLSYCSLLIGFILICSFLLLLYFFYKYLVYVVIVMFCLAGTMGLYYCLKPLVHRLCKWEGRVPANKLPVFKHRPYYKDIILLLPCMGLAIFWGIMRHEPYAWVIQDILGYAFCLNVMKTVFIPNMKICTIMLVMLFIYDIFFVFITPFFTKDGESIMVKVATGGEGGGGEVGGEGSQTPETIPMVFLMPRLYNGPLSACQLPFSLLGFGDIIIPGLLVSHNKAFDMRVNSRHAYYITTCIGYGLGLIITYIALAFMQNGQPALLYLVPCTLIPTFALGLYRHEVRQLWTGNIEVQIPPVTSGSEEAGTVNNSHNTLDSNASQQSTTSGSDNDTKALLKK